MDKYYLKYLKYKTKYFELQNISSSNNIQTGGTKVFDLSKNYPEYKKGDLQNNLKKFKKKYGMTFAIKYEDIKINVIIKKEILPSDIEFYRMVYDTPHRTSSLLPFVIDFIDLNTLEKNNNTYIANIHKTDKISGTDMVKICLAVNRILGAEKTILGDGTKIMCEQNKEYMNLSYLKLIERGTTFYMNLGFDYEINEDTQSVFMYYRYTDKNKFMNDLNKNLENIRKIKIIDIIQEIKNTLDLVNFIIKDGYKKNFDILLNNSIFTIKDYTYLENPKSKINDLFNECKDILDILNKYSNEIYLYKLLVKLFKESCAEYTKVFNYVAKNQRYKIIYGNKIITRDYIDYFNFASASFRFPFKFSYVF